MTYVFLLVFSWFVLKAKTRRQVLVWALVGTTAAVLIAPPRVHAQGGLVGAIQAVLNVINGAIHGSLTSVTSVRSAMNGNFQNLIWPVALINQARAQITQMTSQYRNLMWGIFNINVASATLPVTQQLEQVIRNQQTSDFALLKTNYGNAYGPVPSATTAGAPDRAMTDMDDAMALDVLSQLKASDAAATLTLQTADQIENTASQAAPGSAPFLTASAVAACIQSQAITQKMLAADLRDEAARLAHMNALRKQGAAYTGQLGNQLINLLRRN